MSVPGAKGQISVYGWDARGCGTMSISDRIAIRLRQKEDRIFPVTCLPWNAMKILDTPSQPAPRVAGDVVIEMKSQAEWVIDCQLDKLSKHFPSGFPVHTYYPITSGWRSVIFRTDHPDKGDNWANWDWNLCSILPQQSKMTMHTILYSLHIVTALSDDVPPHSVVTSECPSAPRPSFQMPAFQLRRRGRRLGQRFGNSCPHGLTKNIYKYP